ncbi:MAG: polysaccharide deacetylase [Clostridia bacterium]|nr:polysaccharide deacetylase [Clostridia bacterium]
MIYGLMEVEKPKMNKKKIVIVVSIAVAIIALICATIFYFVKFHGKSVGENNTIEKDSLAVAPKEMKQKQKHEAVVNFLPIYSQEAKVRLNNIYHSGEKAVYLTFDDGPSKTVTPLILDVLKQENVKATFFLLGSRVELNPSIVKREYQEGHYIANHGYSHVYPQIYSSIEAILDEYNKTRQAIQNAIGLEYDGHLFRFPGGSTGGKYKKIKEESKQVLEENQIGYIDWNALTNDSAGAKTKEALMENMIKTVGEKTTVVILMHDAGDKILTYEVLPEMIAYLREKGYVFKNFYDIME